MQAADESPGSAASSDEDQSSSSDSGGPDGPAGHEGPCRCDYGEAGAVDCGASRVAQALQSPIWSRNTVIVTREQAPSEQSGEAGPAARGPGRLLLRYFLRVPFTSSVEAETARQSLASHGEQQQGAVQLEFRIFGNLLEVQLTAEDRAQLEFSINSCLDEISLLVWIMDRFVPPFALCLS